MNLSRGDCSRGFADISISILNKDGVILPTGFILLFLGICYHFLQNIVCIMHFPISFSITLRNKLLCRIESNIRVHNLPIVLFKIAKSSKHQKIYNNVIDNSQEPKITSSKCSFCQANSSKMHK